MNRPNPPTELRTKPFHEPRTIEVWCEEQSHDPVYLASLQSWGWEGSEAWHIDGPHVDTQVLHVERHDPVLDRSIGGVAERQRVRCPRCGLDVVAGDRHGQRGGVRSLWDDSDRPGLKLQLARYAHCSILAVAHPNRGEGDLCARVGLTAVLRQVARLLLFAIEPPDDDSRLIVGIEKANETGRTPATVCRKGSAQASTTIESPGSSQRPGPNRPGRHRRHLRGDRIERRRSRQSHRPMDQEQQAVEDS